MDYMKYAIELAKKGIGSVNPNPLVGAVIVKNDRIIGEGWHKKYGDWHAEVNAFNSALCDVAGADMYVTLEPCSHYGKTPPCAKAIIEHKIKRVFIGMPDPNPLVAGKGIKMLRDAGIEVFCGINEDECRNINKIFLKYITTNKPFVVMKTAMTLDGKIAAYTGDSKWISSDGSRRAVQHMRKALSAIMVGVNTIITDNPSLVCHTDNAFNPIKIIVDSKLRVPLNSRIFDDLPNTRCIIAVSNDFDKSKATKLIKMGAEIIEAPDDNGQVDLSLLMQKLGELNIDSVLLEGGGTLNFSALKANIVDMYVSFIAPKIIGGAAAKTPVEGAGYAKIDSAIMLDNINIKEYFGDLIIYGNVRGH